jgi:hypothetical protein
MGEPRRILPLHKTGQMSHVEIEFQPPRRHHRQGRARRRQISRATPLGAADTPFRKYTINSTNPFEASSILAPGTARSAEDEPTALA